MHLNYGNFHPDDQHTEPAALGQVGFGYRLHPGDVFKHNLKGVMWSSLEKASRAAWQLLTYEFSLPVLQDYKRFGFWGAGAIKRSWTIAEWTLAAVLAGSTAAGGIAIVQNHQLGSRGEEITAPAPAVRPAPGILDRLFPPPSQ